MKKLTYIYLALLLLVLIIPLTQTFIKISEEPSLGGYIKKVKKPEFTFKKYVSNKYSKDLEKYLKYNYGYRALFIRTYNQYKFTFFNKMSAWGIIVGKDNHLFANQYVVSQYGEDFIGEDTIQEKVRKLKFVQEELRKKGKGIVTLVAPSKGSFHKEYIPQHMRGKDTITNYKCFIKEFNKNGINYIDFNNYFLEIKNKTVYPIYTKHGIHWSEYGAYLALDSTLKNIEKAIKIDLPDLILDSITVANASKRDRDILTATNLIFKIPDQKYAYPKVSYIKRNKDSLRVLVSGDSFYGAMSAYSFLQEAFYDSEFWYYYKDIRPKRMENGKKLSVSDLNIEKEIEKFDYFILISNETKLKEFAWSFIEDFYRILKKES